ncbi:androgen-induced gene 1 protein isoform X15 [Bubalus kerabau]|uniref:androgen-induced gene 1 protein isoform X9 n=1 Tax=Bubalus bubalis TaxID=89462 RepID=UPI001E1B6A29|nr:androgen-induced gene 1 protein isoform X9 [Bubalus bubalis]XP_055391788.1 androgen-induced gene 1 protein isoform X15 [Bubalus carabanensis]
MALVPCQVLRVAILLSYCSILCNYKAIEMPSHQTYGGSWKFLTFIDLILGTLSLILSLREVFILAKEHGELTVCFS